MEPVTSEVVFRFLQQLGENYPNKLTFYLLGGSALCLLGSPRETLDIDYTIELDAADINEFNEVSIFWYFNNPAPTVIYQSIFFTINVIFLGIIIGRLRIDSGSIWIATMAHAAHNAINFELFAAIFLCAQCELYVGEDGIIMGIIYGLIVVWILIKSKKSANSGIVNGIHIKSLG